MNVKRGKKSQITRILFLVLFIIAGFLLKPLTVMAEGEEEQEAHVPGKIINVVYDDSRSMYATNINDMSGASYITRWSQAKYALEVFTAMMGENDVINIYPISEKGQNHIEIDGNDDKRTGKVHDWTSSYAGTDFAAYESASDALKADTSGKEKWLVILSDGAFDTVSQDAVAARINDDLNTSDININYMEIGDTFQLPSIDNDRFYGTQCEDGIDILNGVTEIANRIFEHQVLADSYQESIDADIPTDQIIVFAQGSGVNENSIGKMTLVDEKGNSETYRPVSVQSVKYSDVKPEDNEMQQRDTSLIPADEGLNGIVAAYQSSADAPFPEGTLSIPVTGADSVQYYYKPGVKINCVLTDADGTVINTNDGERNTVPAGTYNYRMNFVNRATGEEVDSDRLPADQIDVSVTNNGEPVQTDGKSLTITEGTVDITGTAHLPGDVNLTDTVSLAVMEGLDLMVVSNPESYTQEQLMNPDPDSEDVPFEPLVVEVKKKDGSNLSKDEASALQMNVSDAEGKDDLAWESRKKEGTDNQWEVWPRSADSSTFENITTGARTVNINGSFDTGGSRGTGDTTADFVIGEYQESTGSLRFTMDYKDPFDLRPFHKNDPVKMTVTYKNPETGQWTKLDEKTAKTLKLDGFKVTDENGKEKSVKWKVKKTDIPGEYLVSPDKGFHSLLLPACIGTHDFHIQESGTLKYNLYKISGDETTPNPVRFIGPALLQAILAWGILLLILYWIIKIIKKPKIKHGLHPIAYSGTSPDRDPNARIRKLKVKRNIWTLLLPWCKAQTGEISLRRAPGGCDRFRNYRLKMVAKTNNTFKLTNKNLDIKNVRVAGRQVEKQEDLLKPARSYQGFSLIQMKTDEDMNAQVVTGGFLMDYKDKKRKNKKNRKRK